MNAGQHLCDLLLGDLIIHTFVFRRTLQKRHDECTSTFGSKTGCYISVLAVNSKLKFYLVFHISINVILINDDEQTLLSYRH